jgi:hypothetical protein
MNLDLFYAFTVAFVGATLFLLVDKYEREGPMAHLLKFLVAVRSQRGDPAQIAADAPSRESAAAPLIPPIRFCQARRPMLSWRSRAR